MQRGDVEAPPMSHGAVSFGKALPFGVEEEVMSVRHGRRDVLLVVLLCTVSTVGSYTKSTAHSGVRLLLGTSLIGAMQCKLPGFDMQLSQCRAMSCHLCSAGAWKAN